MNILDSYSVTVEDIFMWIETSTYVENTNKISIARNFIEDHLHIRGEHLNDCTVSDQLQGSPPPTWRIPSDIMMFFAHMRITSTYVENTLLIVLVKLHEQDHLHLRGEYLYLFEYVMHQ